MRVSARILLMVLVCANLTLICQGHDVGASHSGQHLSIFAEHDEDVNHAASQVSDFHSESTWRAQNEGHRAEIAAVSRPPDISIPTVRTCVVGLAPGALFEGGNVSALGTDLPGGVGAWPTPFGMYDAASVVPFVTQSLAWPDKPPPRFVPEM